MSKMESKKRKKKKRKTGDGFDAQGSGSLSNYQRARLRMLVANNLFDYALNYGLPRENVDVFEQQFYQIRRKVQVTLDQLRDAVIVSNLTCHLVVTI
jgi:hypothetical protein